MEDKMVNKKILFGIFVIVLVFGIVIVGCDNGSTGNGGGGGGSGNIVGVWYDDSGSIALTFKANGDYELYKTSNGTYKVKSDTIEIWNGSGTRLDATAKFSMPDNMHLVISNSTDVTQIPNGEYTK